MEVVDYIKQLKREIIKNEFNQGMIEFYRKKLRTYNYLFELLNYFEILNKTYQKNKDEIIKILINDIKDEILLDCNFILDNKKENTQNKQTIEKEFNKIKLLNKKENKEILLFKNINYIFNNKLEEKTFNDYLLEANEIITKIEENCINYENSLDNEVLKILKRELHTLKGNTRLLESFELDKSIKNILKLIEEKTHYFEDIIINDSLINNINIFFSYIDFIKEILEKFENKKNIIDLNGFKELFNYNKKEENENDVILNNFIIQFKEYIQINILNKKDFNLAKLKRSSKGFYNYVKKKNIKKHIKFIEEIYSNVENKNFDKIYNLINSTQKTNKKIDISNKIYLNKETINNLEIILNNMFLLNSEYEYLLKKYSINNNEFINFKKKFNKNMDSFNNLLNNIKMEKIGTLFKILKRSIRDIANELNKKVEVEIMGEESILDKDIYNKLQEPLVHIVRNAVYHGIESISERIEKDKNEKGKINLKAFNERGNIVVEISDDGRGINKEKIKNKANKLNIKYDENNIYNLIFLPNFSTNDEVDNISGRGIGMDIVKNVINSLNGNIKIESKKNEGTKFILKIPINLSIVNGILIKINNIKYILPINKIDKIIKNNFEIRSYKNEYFLKQNNEIYPIYSFNSNSNYNNKIYILLKNNEKYIAFMIDEVIEKNKYLNKKLPDILKNEKYLFGVSILGNGEILGILNIEYILNGG
ncbi:CheW-like protein [Hypnocyclicus thermotrophus]|uniref:histidine kinase n=1 Tax=Hypnocyclicus thermotrophus TaxID=1627895 RepID=A0AA46E0Y5_9FUSO|nr:ATP-binding protein [Hypnocyclicus thermotrophus]TDT72512.1 CheW-like protein [Hypnocyclicus thermotrophus]